MKFTEIYRVKISHVCKPLLSEKNTFHMILSEVIKTKP